MARWLLLRKIPTVDVAHVYVLGTPTKQFSQLRAKVDAWNLLFL
jgi:hypothetical protein